MSWMSTYVLVVISPEITTSPVLTSVSQATRPVGSSRITASRTPSEIWSAILSGCPSVTDSDVNRNSLSANWVMWSRKMGSAVGSLLGRARRFGGGAGHRGLSARRAPGAWGRERVARCPDFTPFNPLGARSFACGGGPSGGGSKVGGGRVRAPWGPRRRSAANGRRRGPWQRGSRLPAGASRQGRQLPVDGSGAGEALPPAPQVRRPVIVLFYGRPATPGQHSCRGALVASPSYP